MKIEFVGTRGNIESSTRLHRRHTSTIVSYRGRRVLIDAGMDWDGVVDELEPDAIVITHAHPDHCFGLRNGAPCVVWATNDAWHGMVGFAIEERQVIIEREPVVIAGIEFEAFPVEHSLRAPAVGYRVTAGEVAVFYAPDVVYIPDRAEALTGVDVYIGDGATIDGNLVRRRGDQLYGHAAFRTQLTWCQKEGVPRAIATHCGSQIVEGDEHILMRKLREYAAERGGIEVAIAYDGMEITLR